MQFGPEVGADVGASFHACIDEYGTPSSTLTDNGLVGGFKWLSQLRLSNDESNLVRIWY